MCSARSITTAMSCSISSMVFPSVLARGEDEGRHVLLLVDGHAGHRLVEQQHTRLLGQRAAKLDPLLEAVGEVVDRGVAQVRDLEQVEDPLHVLALRDLVVDHERQSQHGRDHPAAPCR